MLAFATPTNSSEASKTIIYQIYIYMIMFPRTVEHSSKRRRKPTSFNYHHEIPMNKSGMGQIYIGNGRLNADVEALLLVIA